MVDDSAMDRRARASATKRTRTRLALLNAARQIFETSGWTGTRMEDIASGAHVSVATAYNHFEGKWELLTQIYAPLVVSEIPVAKSEFRVSDPIERVLASYVRDLATTMRRHRNLTVSMAHAIAEHADRSLRSGVDGELPALGALPDRLRKIVECGQEAGELRPFPSAPSIATLVINELLLRTIEQPDELPEMTAEITLTVLFGALKPELLIASGHHGRPFTLSPS